MNAKSLLLLALIVLFAFTASYTAAATTEEQILSVIEAILADDTTEESESDADMTLTINEDFLTRFTRILKFNLNEFSALLFPSGKLFDSVIDQNRIIVNKNADEMAVTRKGNKIRVTVPLAFTINVHKKVLLITFKPTITAAMNLHMDGVVKQDATTKKISIIFNASYEWTKDPKISFINLKSFADKQIKPKLVNMVQKAQEAVNDGLAKLAQL